MKLSSRCRVKFIGQKIGDFSAGVDPFKNSSYPLVVIALEPGVLYGDKV